MPSLVGSELCIRDRIYLLFLVSLLLTCCYPDQAKDNGKDETIEYFIPLSHRVEKDVDEMFEEYRYVPLGNKG